MVETRNKFKRLHARAGKMARDGSSLDTDGIDQENWDHHGRTATPDRDANTARITEPSAEISFLSRRSSLTGKGGGRGRQLEITKPKKLRNKRRQMRRKAKLTAKTDFDNEPNTVLLQPIARPARFKRRHWGLLFSFFVLVIGPLCASIFYLWAIAEDQYASLTGFTVRSQESSAASDLLGGLAQFAGASTASDSDIIYEFIQSQEMVEAVNAKINLRAHYSQHWPNDWVFAIWPDATQEELASYWQRIVSIAYDSATGLIEIEARAFDPDTAQQITRAIVEESQARINVLNLQAREDAMSYARTDLDDAIELLKSAREALTQFRNRTQIVDPESDIQARMGVMNNLQQQLAEALIQYDLLRGSAAVDDPRLTDVKQLIEVIRNRIEVERNTFASASTETGGIGENYPTLIAEFERLTVDLEYAEVTYRAALTALEAARDEATRQSRYLATYIRPTRAEDPEYPQRLILAGLVALFLLLGWFTLALIYYSIRDRS